MMILNPYRYAAPSGNTDDFSADTLASYTEYADGAANWSIADGALTTSTANQSILTRNGVSFANGQVSCVLTESNDAGLVLRLQDNNNYYVAVVADASNGVTPNRVSLFKRVGGSFTSVTGPYSGISFTRGTSHTFSFSISGSLLVAKFDDVPVLSVSDTSIASAGKCGPRSGSNGAFKMDSFTWP